MEAPVLVLFQCPQSLRGSPRFATTSCVFVCACTCRNAKFALDYLQNRRGLQPCATLLDGVQKSVQAHAYTQQQSTQKNLPSRWRRGENIAAKLFGNCCQSRNAHESKIEKHTPLRYATQINGYTECMHFRGGRGPRYLCVWPLASSCAVQPPPDPVGLGVARGLHRWLQ